MSLEQWMLNLMQDQGGSIETKYILDQRKYVTNRVTTYTIGTVSYIDENCSPIHEIAQDLIALYYINVGKNEKVS